MWSPKRNKDGGRSRFYDNMKEVSPGDVVFSFRNQKISDVGIAKSFSGEAPKPAEFGSAGKGWEQLGWKVLVTYHKVSPITPADYMDDLRPLLPASHSPIRADGGGNQMYLAEISGEMAAALLKFLGSKAQEIVDSSTDVVPLDTDSFTEDFDGAIESDIDALPIPKTDRVALILARVGQGRFRMNVRAVEQRCRVTGVTQSEHLIASHIKPWRHSDDSERLDGQNGLMLTPTVDHLFDKGFISFSDEGKLLVSTVLDNVILEQFSLPLNSGTDAGTFSKQQRSYLKYHRDMVFKTAVPVRQVRKLHPGA